MKQLCIVLCALISATCVLHTASPRERYTLLPVVKNLYIPWEIQVGPDNDFWVTERHGLLSRIDPTTGEKRVLLDLRDSVSTSIENGMLGFVMHPRFDQQPYIWVGYVRKGDTSAIRTVARYTLRNDSLVEPVRILEIDTAGDIHQGSRMMITPDDKLFITMGDGNWSEKAQDTFSLRGKLLRYELDGSVPVDNPVPGNPLWTMGHRNQQGITMLPDGRIFTAEHGSVLEDEVNEIIKGRNYGWPYAEGPCDMEDEVPMCDSLNVKEPIWSTGEVTYGVSELGFYDHERYPNLQNSLILLSLKQSTIYQLRFNEERTAIVETIPMLAFAAGRLRALHITQDGRIFLTSSNRDQGGFAPFPNDDDDMIMELVPVAEGAEHKYRSLQDTLTVTGALNLENYGWLPIRNDGDAPMTIDAVYYDGWTSNFFNAQWRRPLVVLPKSTYNIAVGFMPKEEGVFEDRLKIHVVESDTTYVYVIFGIGTTTSVETASAALPLVHPNPTTGQVTFSAGQPTDISVEIRDLLGRIVWSGHAEQSAYLVWDGMTNAGSCPPGSYHAVVTIGRTTTGTLLLRR